MDAIKLADFKISVFTVPTQADVESDGTLEWSSTTMILVELKAGNQWGLGYTYGNAGIAPCAHSLIENNVLGQNALDISFIWSRLNRAIRNDGKSGLAAMAVSAIDVALWDLKAKILNISLADLLGCFRHKIEVYGSGGFTSATYPELEQQMRDWKNQGLRRFKMKVGTHPNEDPSRVAFVRECVGPQADLMVDANEAYDATTALMLAQSFAKQEVSWFEQPLRSQDIHGMTELRTKLPLGMVLADGEYIYDSSQTLNILQNRSADVVQLDVTRCQGITGFLKSAALCEAFNIPISTHCAPSLHVALGSALPGLLHLEYFFDHVRIEQEFFDGVMPAKNGFLTADLSRPGMGMIFKEKDAERFRR